jgi:hypothetical protein
MLAMWLFDRMRLVPVLAMGRLGAQSLHRPILSCFSRPVTPMLLPVQGALLVLLGLSPLMVVLTWAFRALLTQTPVTFLCRAAAASRQLVVLSPSQRQMAVLLVRVAQLRSPPAPHAVVRLATLRCPAVPPWAAVEARWPLVPGVVLVRPVATCWCMLVLRLVRALVVLRHCLVRRAAALVAMYLSLLAAASRPWVALLMWLAAPPVLLALQVPWSCPPRMVAPVVRWFLGRGALWAEIPVMWALHLAQPPAVPLARSLCLRLRVAAFRFLRAVSRVQLAVPLTWLVARALWVVTCS